MTEKTFSTATPADLAAAARRLAHDAHLLAADLAAVQLAPAATEQKTTEPSDEVQCSLPLAVALNAPLTAANWQRATRFAVAVVNATLALDPCDHGAREAFVVADSPDGREVAISIEGWGDLLRVRWLPNAKAGVPAGEGDGWPDGEVVQLRTPGYGSFVLVQGATVGTLADAVHVDLWDQANLKSWADAPWAPPPESSEDDGQIDPALMVGAGFWEPPTAPDDAAPAALGLIDGPEGRKMLAGYASTAMNPATPASRHFVTHRTPKRRPPAA